MDPETFGQFLSGERHAKGWTQKQLAERLGVTDKAVSKWERGICLPDVAKFSDIAGALGVSETELLRSRRFPASEPQKTRGLFDGQTVRRLLAFWLAAAAVCHGGTLLEFFGLIRIIGLFDLFQPIAGGIGGIVLASRREPCALTSRRMFRYGLLLAVLLTGMVLCVVNPDWFWDAGNWFLYVTRTDWDAFYGWNGFRGNAFLWNLEVILKKFAVMNLVSPCGAGSLFLELTAYMAFTIRRSGRGTGGSVLPWDCR